LNFRATLNVIPAVILRAALLLALFLPTAAFAAPLPEPRPRALDDLKLGHERQADKLKLGDKRKPEEQTAEENVPLPEPRPDNLVVDFGPHPPPPGLVEAEVSPDPIPDSVCDELETSGEAEFERLPRIMEGQCSALTPIKLSALAPKDGQRVEFESPVTVSCSVARQALVWLAAAVQPAAQKHLGGPIVKFRQTGGYECRGRNRDPKAKISEHGMANALDIGGFERSNGVVVPVSDKGEAELGFLNDIRAAACGPFTTVLGPGVAAHEEHFHLDLAHRAKKGRYSTYCR
jgi:hypothetical protein